MCAAPTTPPAPVLASPSLRGPAGRGKLVGGCPPCTACSDTTAPRPRPGGVAGGGIVETFCRPRGCPAHTGARPAYIWSGGKRNIRVSGPPRGVSGPRAGGSASARILQPKQMCAALPHREPRSRRLYLWPSGTSMRRPSFAVVHVGAPHLASGALMGLLFQRLPEPRIRAAAVDAGMGPIWRSERRSGAHTPRPAPHGHTPSTPTNATQFQRAAYRHEAPPAGTSKPT
jgi:hypothetical protein